MLDLADGDAVRWDRSKGVRGTFQKSLTWQFPTARGSKRVAFGKWCRPWLQLYLYLLLFREPQVFPRNQAYLQLYYSRPNDVGAVSRLFIAFRHGCCLGAKLLLVTGGSIRAYHTNTCHDSLRAETSMQRVEYRAIRLCCYWYSKFCLSFHFCRCAHLHLLITCNFAIATLLPYNRTIRRARFMVSKSRVFCDGARLVHYAINFFRVLQLCTARYLRTDAMHDVYLGDFSRFLRYSKEVEMVCKLTAKASITFLGTAREAPSSFRRSTLVIYRVLQPKHSALQTNSRHQGSSGIYNS